MSDLRDIIDSFTCPDTAKLRAMRSDVKRRLQECFTEMGMEFTCAEPRKKRKPEITG